MNLNIRQSKARLLAVLLFPVFIAGCKVDYALPKNEALRLSRHEAGQPVQVRTLEENDPARQAISQWLAANSEGWEYGFITRDPQIYLEGKNFSINITKMEVQLKYCRAFYECHYWIKQDGTLFSKLKSS